MNIGHNILELRKQKNITQEDLAAELGVTATAISKWENNYTLPDILMLCALADYFDVTTDELLGRNRKFVYAMIAAETEVLGQQIADIAMGYGFASRGIFTNYIEATEAARQNGGINHIIAGFHDGFYGDTAFESLVSVGPTEQDILDGIHWVLKNPPRK